MNEWIIILLLILDLLALTLPLRFVAIRDFRKRVFKTLAEKNKWRYIIYYVPFGVLYYLKLHYNMPLKDMVCDRILNRNV